MNFFEVLSNSNECKARTGILRTDNSEIETPVFMPVGTLGTVKAVTQRDLEELKVKIILANSYHLYLRPGTDILSKAAGLRNFMNWKNSILTDSGGFQIFSLASLARIESEGVTFSSHLDGSKHFLSPEDIIDVQRKIGSDIMMPLDICLPFPVTRKDTEDSLKITYEWEKRCYEKYVNSEPLYNYNQFLFSICQGSVYKDLRKRSIEELETVNFHGNAIGGLAVGEENELMYDIVDFSTDLLSKDKPRYLMGVGTPVDLLECVERGVDMFDCVLPTRNARHGRIFTFDGEINLKNAKYKVYFGKDFDDFESYTSGNFSLAYLSHLFRSNEILGMQLATIHNLGFYFEFMKRIKIAIFEGRFRKFKKDFLNRYLTAYNNNNSI
jgi:queuine tRNA-ribosyltransferase